MACFNKREENTSIVFLFTLETRLFFRDGARESVPESAIQACSAGEEIYQAACDKTEDAIDC